MSNVYILIGAPASGKSTWARERFDKKDIVSSDDIREFVYGDPSIQGNPWPLVYDIIRMKLEAGHENIVVDATSVKRKDRRRLINFIRTHAVGDVHIKGVVFDTHKDILIKRNEERERSVPASVINNMLNALRSAEPSTEEGMDEVIKVD